MGQNTLHSLFSLEGKTAVVLGGTSGIGQAIARAFAQAGADVVASSRDAGKVNAMADEFEKLGAKTMRITTDITSRESLEALADSVVKEFGHVDVLMVTSGALRKVPSTDMNPKDWQDVIDANLTGSFYANQVFGKIMIGQGKGSIINTGSMTSFVNFSDVVSYAASKGGVVMLTKSLAADWAKHNVRVNAIAPGVFKTPLNTKALDDPNRAAAIIARTPMGRLGKLEELTGLAIFLASDASSFVTGQVIAVDGGFLAKGV